MTVFTRIVHDRDNPAADISIRVFPPMAKDGGWRCRVEIDWPGKPWGCDVGGIDAIQAFELALQMIGTQLYCSDLHAAGRLVWLEPGDGYGFPVPRTIRDMLVGRDRERFG